MSRSLPWIAVLALLAGGAGLRAQMTLAPENGGAGSDGAFFAAMNTTIDTTLQSVYQFTTFGIAAGVTVTCTGPLPLVIKVQGTVQIDGTLVASGVAGGPSGNGQPGGAGGAGGSGGGAGGAGGTGFVGAGMPGLGLAGGQPGVDGGLTPGTFTDPVGGGGGGGNAFAGMNGAPPNAGPGPSASGMGGPVAPVCRAGSGGGGGGNDLDDLVNAAANDGGGGGGGGGGYIVIASDNGIVVSITGSIRADGGNGGNSSGNGGAGGGGSGGAVELLAPTITIDGMVTALGAAGGAATQSNCGCSAGGAGGDGCIFLSGASITMAGTLSPAPALQGPTLLLNAVSPVGVYNVTAPTPTSTYIVVFSFAPAAVPIPTPFGPVQIDLADPLFNLLFPVNNLPTIFTNLVGIGGGQVGINFLAVPLPPNFELTVIGQGVSISAGGALDGVSNVVNLTLKF